MNLPVDFVNRMREMLGDEADSFFASYDEEHYVGLRINPLKYTGDVSELKSMFDMRPVPWCRTGYYYNNELRPGKHPYHDAGVYYIQEPSAMVVGQLADVRPGEKVLDLCAAPGGKTSHLAGMLGGKGLLWANEIVPGRAQILSQNVERMGIRNAVVSCMEPSALADRVGNFFTTVVVDTPCSGEGMFRRDEIARTEWSASNVQMCGERGQDILEAADRMLKMGGRLVYSTCTFAPVEDEKAICTFIGNHPEYHIEKCNIDRVCGVSADDGWLSQGVNDWGKGLDVSDTFRLWPHKLHGEGHYVAVLRKGDESSLVDVVISPSTAKSGKKSGNADKGKSEAVKVYKDWAAAVGLTEELTDVSDERYMMLGDMLYLLPEGVPNLKGIRFERVGIQLGEIKKNRFEPSHSLAMVLSMEDIKNINNVTCDSDDCARYLRGESIECDINLKGWTLVTVDAYSLGWGKAVNGMLKNHYPKGLRKN